LDENISWISHLTSVLVDGVAYRCRVSVSCSAARTKGIGRTLDSGPDKLVDKLLLDIKDDHALSAELLGLDLDSIEVLLLTTVGKEADNLVALEDQPSEDGAGVET
jgi:hypothetical protein